MRLKLNIKVTLVSAIATLFCLLMFAGYTVHAQSGLGIKVQPTTIDESVDPGTVLEGVLRIKNELGGSQTYYINRRNIVGMEDTGRPIFSKEFRDDPLEAASWLKPSKNSVDIAVGETVEVPYEIVVPADASPGSYHAAFFVTREAEITTESGAGVGFNVASLVNIRVSGDIIESMLYRELSTDSVFYKTPSVLFTSRIDNTGTIHQRPRGIITISDMLGNEVGQITFNDQAGAILAKSDRVFDASWSYDGFALGRYSVLASIVYGETQRTTLTRKTSFWVVPLKGVGMVVGSIVLFLALLILGVRTYVSRALKRAGYSQKEKEEQSQNVTLARKLIRTTVWVIGIILLLFIGMIVFFS